MKKLGNQIYLMPSQGKPARKFMGWIDQKHGIAWVQTLRGYKR